ncbi:extracellular calcium-sensing receptor-like [Garra rufa]|uniref:extracellular calcium-sensing receptor-like n=1 Tax=Garra rufa TaxID=137080 RepID=UPI003CCE91A9
MGAVTPLLKVIAQHNITGLQWVGSESWITSRTLAETKEYSFISGALGFAIANAKLIGLQEFLVNVHPDQEPKNEILKEFWETTFQCSFRTIGNGASTGSERLAELQYEYTDVSELRIANKVYTAVYAVAHTLHNVLKDLQSSTNSSTREQPTPQKMLAYMRNVRFTVKTGEGDPVARYDLVNRQPAGNVGLQYQHVGVYDSSLPSKKCLQVNQCVVLWAKNTGQLPVSVCSESCPSGTRKAVLKGRPICCYDCVPCAEGDSFTESNDCFPCDLETADKFYVSNLSAQQAMEHRKLFESALEGPERSPPRQATPQKRKRPAGKTRASKKPAPKSQELTCGSTTLEETDVHYQESGTSTPESIEVNCHPVTKPNLPLKQRTQGSLAKEQHQQRQRKTGGEESAAEGGAVSESELEFSTPPKKYPTRRRSLKLVLTPVKSALLANVSHKNLSPLKIKKALVSSTSTTLMGMHRQKRASNIVKKAIEKRRKKL